MIIWETMYALIIFGPLQYSSASSRQAAYLGPSSECIGLVLRSRSVLTLVARSSSMNHWKRCTIWSFSLANNDLVLGRVQLNTTSPLVGCKTQADWSDHMKPTKKVQKGALLFRGSPHPVCNLQGK